ncbi:hypothetical protein [Paenibacillus xylanexedens]|uniref:hypothetical protein n=1 Tax=Paenibacillus xylanexedens TaxID=528191 RepID=UPI0011A801B1|nr:hypothetical protein [Paenibacillus xylanexedens]
MKTRDPLPRGNVHYATYYTLKDCITHQTANARQIMNIRSAMNLGRMSPREIERNLTFLIDQGYVEKLVGTNPHTGVENETLYRVIP